MRATVVSVGRVAKGSVLVTAITSPSTTLEVDFGADFSPDGGQVTVAGHTLTYTGVLWSDQPEDGVTVDTLVLSGTAGFSAPKWTRVDVPGSVEYVAQVKPAGTNGILTATLDHPLIDDEAFLPTAASEGVLVEVEKRGRGFYVTKLYNRAPALNLSNAVALSLPLTAINASGTPSAGTVLTATGPSSAAWTMGGGGDMVEMGGGHYGDPYGDSEIGGGHYGDPYG